LFDRLRKVFSDLVQDISTRDISESDLESSMWNFQLALMECDVAVPVAEDLAKRLKEKLVGTKVKRFEDISPIVESAFKELLAQSLPTGDLLQTIRASGKKPFVIMFVGVNGTGKTTTIAKVAKYLLDHSFSVIMACSDTFRAGSEEQIEVHAARLNVKVIKHRYGADPAAVAFDAVSYASNNGLDIVLIDTAGRMQTDKGLMDQLQKIHRVANPDAVVFVGDSLTGNDALQQAEEFNKYVSVDGIILTKVDADSKGGAALSISGALGKPIFFLGVGQEYKDIIAFDPNWVIKNVLEKAPKT
jgi:fused signal recognition particle receptor